MPDSPPAFPLNPQARSPGRFTAFHPRTRVTAAVSVLFFAGLLAGAIVPSVVGLAVLVPAELSHPTSWYRLLTFGLVQASLSHWLVVAGIALASGWLAERWLEPRTMWTVGVIATLVSGIVYGALAPPLQPAIGGGFVVAGFAGAAVAASVRHRRTLTRGAQAVALVLLLMYGLAPLRPDAQSLAMLGAFLVSGGYAAWRMRSSDVVASGPQSAA